MFLLYVLRFFKKGDTIQGGTLFKWGGGIIQGNTVPMSKNVMRLQKVFGPHCEIFRTNSMNHRKRNRMNL